MNGIKASMAHSEASIRALSAAQYNLFGLAKQLSILITGMLIVIACTFFSLGQTMYVLLMLLGCWMIVSTSLPQKRQADKLIEAMHGHFPETEYTFHETCFDAESAQTLTSYAYNKLAAIAEDERYLYCFISVFSGYMIDKESIQNGTCADLKAQISAASGLKFVRPVSLFRLSLSQIRIRISNRKALKKRKR